MTIKTNEFWIDEPFEEIVRKIKNRNTGSEVWYLQFFQKTFERFPRPWIGEINMGKKSFKLFRVKGSENTSDLSAIGHYTIRGAKPVIVIKHKIHFTVVVGMVGLLIFVISVFFLIQKKGIVVPVALQGVTLVLVIMYYAYTILKDLRQDELAIEKLLTRVLVDVDEINDEDEQAEETD